MSKETLYAVSIVWINNNSTQSDRQTLDLTRMSGAYAALGFFINKWQKDEELYGYSVASYIVMDVNEEVVILNSNKDKV